MSQTRGRYAGSRDTGQRQPRHVKQSQPNRPRPPYVNAPARDSAQTASIFKTRSFQFLVDTVGAENIALGLGSNMARVAELTKGERFTPETAFHMETTLGLPHGFFDQPNPALAPETIARLKSPLDFVLADDEPEAVSETPMPPSAVHGGQQPYPEDSLSGEAQMPKKVTGGSPRAVRNSRSQMAAPPAPRAPQKGSPSKPQKSVGGNQQRPLALDDSSDVEKIRRANLHVLTARNGSKARLGVVMKMSGSNMAHRLYGKKRLDSVEASRFTERLGLPAGWLDTPRSEADIPESVSRLLTPAARGRASVEQKQPLAAATEGHAPGKRTDATANARADVRTGAEDPASAFADGATEKETTVASQHDHVADAPDGPAARVSGEDDGGELPAVISPPTPTTTAATTPATTGSFRTAATPQPSPGSLPPSVTSLDHLHGIAPIAEALLKTLAGKARTGRLDELKALELLHQAVLL